MTSKLQHSDQIFEWIKTQFTEHPNFEQVINRLDSIHTMHTNEDDLNLFIHELASSEFWKFRTLATKNDQTPMFWNPLELPYKEFSNLVQSSSYTINNYIKPISHPPIDIISVILRSKLEGALK